ncbi:MAG: hypothetical protein LUF78_05160 [Clostridiales bacterium]|nr:hypothetical protein [Clostridiales bacterium]
MKNIISEIETDQLCSQEKITCRELTQAYGIGEANRKKFLCYLEEHQNEGRDVLAGYMWVTRAALYGHPEAKRLFAENPVYEECILMPMEMFLEGKGLNYSLDSETLRNAGLSGFPEHTVVSFSSLENEIFMSTTDAGTEGADETGFGMDELYDLNFPYSKWE